MNKCPYNNHFNYPSCHWGGYRLGGFPYQMVCRPAVADTVSYSLQKAERISVEDYILFTIFCHRLLPFD